MKNEKLSSTEERLAKVRETTEKTKKAFVKALGSFLAGSSCDRCGKFVGDYTAEARAKLAQDYLLVTGAGITP